MPTPGASPLQRWWVLIYRGLLAGFAGRDAEAEALAHEAAALGRRLALPAADAYRIGQLSRIYAKQGRLSELDDDIADALVRFPGLVTLRCLRALASATAGRRADAVAEIDALADGAFAALPRDSLYLASLAILAEAAVTCRVTDAAKEILAELSPYATRNLIQGVPVGWGAAAWYIARLQWLLGRARRGHRLGRHRAAAAPSVGSRRAGRSAGRPAPGHGLRRRMPQTPRPSASACGRPRSWGLPSIGLGERGDRDRARGGLHTVERHVANILHNLAVRVPAEATAWAYRRGLVR